MIQKLYPPEQLERYLAFDLILFVFLAYQTILANQPLGWEVAIALYVLMSICFYIGLWKRGWMLVIASWAGLGIIGIYAIFYNEWMLLYGFVYADLLGRARTFRLMGAGMIGITVMFITSYAALHQELHTFFVSPLMPILILQLLTPYIIRTLERARTLSSKLDAANRKLARYIQEEERNRIARDLHDTLGQTLTMIKMKSELAHRLADKDVVRTRSEIDEIKASSRQALQQVRQLVTSMRHVPLAEEMQDAQNLLASDNIALDMEQFTGGLTLPSLVETMLALSLREAVTNVVKHSGADLCSISDHYTENGYCIAIQDNGSGLTPEVTEGFGLSSIQERMHQVQGQALFTSPPSGGTIVELRVPLLPSH